MINKFISTVEKYNMLSAGDRVLVGVSGGADSMLLLHFLLELKDKLEITVEAAHIEHGIRGEESLEDARFVETFCSDNGVPFHMLSIDAVNGAKDNKLSVEEYSRQKRYEFFDSLECDKIATAHNLSDNIETVLFRLSRGTGIKGACGIPPIRGKIIRPLIELSSDEIRAYCDENGIEYKIDSTNFENDYSRNYIRNVVVKSLKELNPSFEKNFESFLEDANEDYDFINSVAEKEYDFCLCDKGLLKEKLARLDKSILKRVIQMYFSESGITLDRMHLNDVADLVRFSGRVQISGGIFAVSNGKYLRIADFDSDVDNCNYEIKILKKFEFNPKTVDFYCDYDKINGSTVIRTRLEGDTISPAGRGCTKSLKKLFNEYAVPVEKRNNIAVICDSDGVIGVAGICCDERVKLDESTENVLALTVSLED